MSYRVVFTEEAATIREQLDEHHRQQLKALTDRLAADPADPSTYTAPGDNLRMALSEDLSVCVTYGVHQSIVMVVVIAIHTR